ncbi:hypothetical protein [Acinetobacter phage HFM1]|nr:hypothetical protein [Acinetobacter phage HFM1]
MKEYLAQYDVDGIRYESFVSEELLNELKKNGQFVWCRKLTNPEIMEILEYGIF